MIRLMNATPSFSSARAANKEPQHALANESMSPPKTPPSTRIQRFRNFSNVLSPSSPSARAANKESQHACANNFLLPLKTPSSTRIKRFRNASDVSFCHKPQTKLPFLKHFTATSLPNLFTNVFTFSQTSSSSNCACPKHK